MLVDDPRPRRHPERHALVHRRCGTGGSRSWNSSPGPKARLCRVSDIQQRSRARVAPIEKVPGASPRARECATWRGGRGVLEVVAHVAGGWRRRSAGSAPARARDALVEVTWTHRIVTPVLKKLRMTGCIARSEVGGRTGGSGGSAQHLPEVCRLESSELAPGASTLQHADFEVVDLDVGSAPGTLERLASEA